MSDLSCWNSRGGGGEGREDFSRKWSNIAQCPPCTALSHRISQFVIPCDQLNGGRPIHPAGRLSACLPACLIVILSVLVGGPTCQSVCLPAVCLSLSWGRHAYLSVPVRPLMRLLRRFSVLPRLVLLKFSFLHHHNVPSKLTPSLFHSSDRQRAICKHCNTEISGNLNFSRNVLKGESILVHSSRES